MKADVIFIDFGGGKKRGFGARIGLAGFEVIAVAGVLLGLRFPAYGRRIFRSAANTPGKSFGADLRGAAIFAAIEPCLAIYFC